MVRDEEGKWEVKKVKCIVEFRLASPTYALYGHFVKEIERTRLPVLGDSFLLTPSGAASWVRELHWDRKSLPVIILEEIVAENSLKWQDLYTDFKNAGWEVR